VASVDFGDIELNVIGLPVLDTMDQVDRLTRAVMDLPLVGIGGEGMPW